MATAAWREAATFPENTTSYRLRAAGGTGVGRASCANLGLGVVVLRVLTLVREVAVLRIDERSEFDAEGADVEARELRDEGGRERGGIRLVVVASGFVLGEGVVSVVSLVLRTFGVGVASCVGCGHGMCGGCPAT